MNSAIFISLSSFYLKHISNSDLDSDQTIFLLKASKFSFISTVLSLFMLTYIRKHNQTDFQNIAIINNLLFSMWFILLSSFLRSYLFSTSDPIVLVISLEVIFRYFILTEHYPSYYIMKRSAQLISFFLIISVIIVHEFIPIPIIIFVITKLLILTFLTFYSKVYENGLITQSDYKNLKEKEKNYYVNILNKLNLGFFIIDGYELKLCNQNINNIYEEFNHAKINNGVSLLE